MIPFMLLQWGPCEQHRRLWRRQGRSRESLSWPLGNLGWERRSCFWSVAPGQSGDKGGCPGRHEQVGDLGPMREGGKCQGNEFGLLYLAGGVQMQDSEGLGVRMKGVRGGGEELWSHLARVQREVSRERHRRPASAIRDKHWTRRVAELEWKPQRAGD